MAQIKEVRLVDDLTGDAADETIEFGIDGRNYEIDLSDGNAKKLRDVLADYVAAEMCIRDRRWRLRTDTSATADELDLTVSGMLGAHFPEVTAVAALSTVPGPSRELRTLLARWSDRMRTLVVGPGVRTGVPLLVDHPREVGADRVVNSLAAHHLFGTTCICVDLGTCTNIDVVTAKGEFLGLSLIHIS